MKSTLAHPARSRAFETHDSSWGGFYRLAAVAAVISILLVVLDMGMSMGLPEGEAQPGARSAVDWFLLFQQDAVYGLRDLGLLNIFNMVLGIPLFLALYAAHRRTQEAFALFAAVLFFIGAVVYMTTNTVVPMVALSQKYAAAATDADRALLVAAGEAMLARGADFTLGSLLGFVLVSISQVIMSWVMLRGHVFGKVAAYAGIFGFGALLVFTVWTTLAPTAIDTAMGLAAVAGLLVLTWNLLVVRRFWQLAGQMVAMHFDS